MYLCYIWESYLIKHGYKVALIKFNNGVSDWNSISYKLKQTVCPSWSTPYRFTDKREKQTGTPTDRCINRQTDTHTYTENHTQRQTHWWTDRLASV